MGAVGPFGRGDLYEERMKPRAPPSDPAPVAPDFTDAEVRKARAAEMARLLARRGRSSTFLTGPKGDTSTPTLGKTMLGGG